MKRDLAASEDGELVTEETGRMTMASSCRSAADFRLRAKPQHIRVNSRATMPVKKPVRRAPTVGPSRKSRTRAKVNANRKSDSPAQAFDDSR